MGLTEARGGEIELLILLKALPSAFRRTLQAYRSLGTLLADGEVRAIAIGNGKGLVSGGSPRSAFDALFSCQRMTW